MKKVLIAAIVVLVAGLLPSSGSALSAEVEKQLQESEYVYISSTRKDGTLSEPAEIWFFYSEGAVYVGTRATSWRVKRIHWGRPNAKIWVGKRDGASFDAVGELVDADTIEALLMKTYATKYPKGWPKYEEKFRKGFVDGTHVVVKYSPTAE